MKTKLLLIIFLFALRLNAGIGAGTSPLGELPVELTTFTAAVTNHNVTLFWRTATELNNLGFEILRFSENEDWSSIGFVYGQINSSTPQDYSFVDESVTTGFYLYRLKQIDTDGSFAYSEVIEVQFGVAPKDYALEQNYPNPFNPSTVISYSIPEASDVSIEVFDVLGNFITTLVNKNQEAGNYKITFNPVELSNGIYFYKIQAGSFVAVKKMLLLK